jgi:capsular polysaccharide biosynthesis protein
MTKVIEILFRNKGKLLALLLLPILVSGVVVFFLPRTYQATARLWALHRYAVVSATGIESDLQSTEAMTQATALNEFLQTRSFDLAVAKDTDLAKHVGVPQSDTQDLQDALYAEISTHVVVTPSSQYLFTITYSNADPLVAMQVVKAVITNFSTASTAYATKEGAQLLSSYQVQLTVAQQQADSATQKVADYLQAHNLTLATAQSDPQYQALSAQATQALTALGTVKTTINTINQQLASLETSLYKTVDAPTLPTKPEARTKSLLLGGGVGLAIGLLGCIGYLLILVRLDQSIYSTADLPAITDYPVLIQIPRLPRRSTAWIAGANGKMLPDNGA